MDTYKYITNSYSGQTVVAYQCGTPVPNVTADLVVEVPCHTQPPPLDVACHAIPNHLLGRLMYYSCSDCQSLS